LALGAGGIAVVLFRSESVPFEVSVGWDYGSGEALVVPRGELDILTAPDFEVALDAVTQGRATTTIDLGDLDFCDAAGVAIFAKLSRRLEDRGGELRLRSPSATVTRILDITGLGGLVTTDPAVLLGPSRASGNVEDLVGGVAESLAPFLADALVDAIMQMVAAIAERMGEAVDAASVTMRRRGLLTTVAASQRLAEDFDQAQYDAGGGPCVDAVTYGHTVHGYPAREPSPWPRLRETAQQAGIHAVLSTPVGDGAQPIAALNLYALGLDFGPAEAELASALAGEAATVLDVAGFDRADLSERLRDALAGRDHIARAQGIMMERHDLAAPQAYSRLIQEATTTSTFLSDTATRVIDESASNSITQGEDEGSDDDDE
jgi:anti-anti-sigma factor